jgi:DNA (cytosine-5)-methyltransferase 1
VRTFALPIFVAGSLEAPASVRKGPRRARPSFHLLATSSATPLVSTLRMKRSREDIHRCDQQLRLDVTSEMPHRPLSDGQNAQMSGAAISLFSGAGGLDLGVEQAGFHTVAAVEWDDDSADSMEKNAHLHFPALREVLRANLYPLAAGGDDGVSTKDILRAGGLGRSRPDLLVGGPPCVAFSKSGFWLDWKRDGVDPAASLLQAYTRVLREAKPRYFILENVYALTFNNKASKPAFERLLREIDDAGYHFSWQVLNAADYGVPQARPRLFIVGARKREKLPELPEATHHGQWERRETKGGPLPHVTSGEALAGLVAGPEPEEVVRGGYGHLLPGIPPGENYLHYTAERGHPEPLFQWRSRYWSFLLKLDPNRPSPTIQAQPGPNVGPFHWDNRRLRVPELRRLFTFPDDYAFVGRRSSVQSQIGNCVPPLLARRVAEPIAALL